MVGEGMLVLLPVYCVLLSETDLAICSFTLLYCPLPAPFPVTIILSTIAGEVAGPESGSHISATYPAVWPKHSVLLFSSSLSFFSGVHSVSHTDFTEALVLSRLAYMLSEFRWAI